MCVFHISRSRGPLDGHCGRGIMVQPYIDDGTTVHMAYFFKKHLFPIYWQYNSYILLGVF